MSEYMFAKILNISLLGLFSILNHSGYNHNLTLFTKKVKDQDIQSFLQNPLDLQKYKIGTEDRCNSGFATREKYYYKPSYKGIYWTYFLCRNLSQNKSGNTQLQIVVYKKDKVGDYMDNKDSLISLADNENDSTLNEANIVGRSYKDFVNQYGSSAIAKDGLFFYQAKNKMSLLIYVDKGYRISWFMFVRLNRMINSFDEIPEKMKKFPFCG